FAGGAEDGELFEQFVEEFYRGRPMTDSGARSRPTQHQPAAMVPAGLEADRGGKGNHLLHTLALLVRRLAAREPGGDQERQVLFVLLLEFLHHELAAPGRGPPVHPPRAIPGPVIAQPMVFDLLRRAVVALPAAVLSGLALDQEPAAAQLPQTGIDDELIPE